MCERFLDQLNAGIRASAEQDIDADDLRIACAYGGDAADFELHPAASEALDPLPGNGFRQVTADGRSYRHRIGQFQKGAEPLVYRCARAETRRSRSPSANDTGAYAFVSTCRMRWAPATKTRR